MKLFLLISTVFGFKKLEDGQVFENLGQFQIRDRVSFDGKSCCDEKDEDRKENDKNQILLELRTLLCHDDFGGDEFVKNCKPEIYEFESSYESTEAAAKFSGEARFELNVTKTYQDTDSLKNAYMKLWKETDKSYSFEAECEPKDCNGHGSCQEGKCYCEEEWASTERCDFPTCVGLDYCNFHGTCSEDGEDFKCNCEDNYAGIKCECENCDGEKYKCQGGTCLCSMSECNDNGSCIVQEDQHYCSCFEGFTGDTCDKKVVECGGCSNHGHCEEDNLCICDDHFSGENCQIECSGNGHVVGPGCKCDEEHRGNNCELEMCSGNGDLVENVCTCNDGWTGGFCDQEITCDEPCKGNTECTDVNTCTCKEGYEGVNCDVPICSVPCSGNWECVTPDHCGCKDGWKGDDCEIPICDEDCAAKINMHCESTRENKCVCNDGWESAENSDAGCTIPVCEPECRNNSTCNEQQTCDCTPGWHGVACELADCQNCSHGTCTEPNVCQCESGWSGDDCSTAQCSGCNGHGQCNEPNICTCEDTWIGSNCEEQKCGDPECSGHGKCQERVNKYHCVCEDGWEGDVCETPVCNCNGHGTCEEPNVCICNKNWQGEACEYEKCQEDSCGSDFSCIDSETSSFVCECKDNICENDSECIEKNDNEPSCVCQPPFEGEFCDKCISGWRGENCAFTDCTAVNCENGACIEPDSGDAFCDCKGSGFHGDQCQINDCNKCSDLEDAGHLEICLHDIFRPDNAKCVCRNDFQDELCFKPETILVEKHTDKYVLACEDVCPQEGVPFLIIGLSAAGFVILTALFSLLCSQKCAFYYNLTLNLAIVLALIGITIWFGIEDFINLVTVGSFFIGIVCLMLILVISVCCGCRDWDDDLDDMYNKTDIPLDDYSPKSVYRNRTESVGSTDF